MKIYAVVNELIRDEESQYEKLFISASEAVKFSEKLKIELKKNGCFVHITELEVEE